MIRIADLKPTPNHLFAYTCRAFDSGLRFYRHRHSDRLLYGLETVCQSSSSSSTSSGSEWPIPSSDDLRRPRLYSHLYTGQRYDPETRLYHYKARYYHPPLGRFVSRDSAGYEEGMNLYQYVCSSPTVQVDPFGQRRQVIAFEGLGGFAGISDPFVEWDWKPKVTAANGEWHYYAQDDVSSAFKKAKELAIKKHTPDANGNCYDTIIILGFSNGGAAADELRRCWLVRISKWI